ncbi:MAG: DNA primase [Holosporaceae bacterium]|jgi:DNA primase|nr:DNA primase [Holosporaceae bacterium]
MDKEFIDFLKSKIAILDVVASKVRLRRSGRDWFGLCPFHKEKTGSFKVDPHLSYYYCFGCGAHGDVINFVMDLEKVSFVEAVERLAATYGIPLPLQKSKIIEDSSRSIYAAMTEIQIWFSNQLQESVGSIARQYLESRKISSKSIEKFYIGYAAGSDNLIKSLRKKGFSDDVLLKTGVFNRSKYGNELINRYNSRLIFPIMDVIGRCVGFGGRTLEKSDAAKYINSPESEIFIKSNQLYGYFLAKRRKSSEFIVTEGYLDVISLHQAGFDGAVAPLGTSLSETQINMCWRVCDEPIICLDGDEAGLKASYRWIDRILSVLQAGKSFKFAKLPDGSDPDSLITNSQISVIEGALKESLPLSDWLWDGAFLLHPSETPEQKAAIIKMLMDKTEIIQDIPLRKLYIQHIKRRERDFYRRRTEKTRKKSNIRPAISVRKKIEKIFIVTIINHPYIMDKIVESFVKIEFGDFHMRELKKRILNHYDVYLSNSDSAKYLAAMREMKMDIDDIALHASFAQSSVSDEEAVEGWSKLWARYNMDPLIMADLQAASSNLKSTFSENDWQRLKALKSEAIQNRGRKNSL